MFTGVGGFELGLRPNESNIPKRPNSEYNTKNKQFKWKCVGVSEIDKYASELLKQRFSGIKNYGDATKINPAELPDFDMLCGGFPCQAFSIAGKRRGFEDTRGTLFFDIARILEVKRPKIVFLENVKGLLNHNKGQTFRTIIQTLSELGYEVQWMVLNSKFFGVPQNRERVFIIASLRGTSRPEILPFRRLNSEIIKQSPQTILDINQAQRVYSTEGTSITIKGLGGGQGAKTGLYAIKTHSLYPRSSKTNKGGTGHLTKEDGQAYCMDTGNMQAIEMIGNVNPSGNGMNGNVYSEEGLSPTIDTNKGEGKKILNNMKIRRLTPTECERLQGFPDGWTEGFSDTQRYKMIGNAVTVNVIRAIAQRLALFNTKEKKE